MRQPVYSWPILPVCEPEMEKRTLQLQPLELTGREGGLPRLLLGVLIEVIQRCP